MEEVKGFQFFCDGISLWMSFLHRWDITFHWISFQCNSLRFPDITSHCHIKLCYIITDCVYLYFVLLSELEHFGLLSQYYWPLGSWSALSKSNDAKSIFSISFDFPDLTGQMTFRHNFLVGKCRLYATSN